MINEESLKKITMTLGDPATTLFNSDMGLLRGVKGERAVLYKKLFAEDVFNNLTQKRLLIETELLEDSLAGFDILFKHRRLPFVSFPEEWSAGMYKDAALHVLELEKELVRYDLTLWDPHPWNVLFDGTRPIWVDLGSIQPAAEDSLWIRSSEFIRFFLYPLRLYAAGHGQIVRSCISGTTEGIDMRVMLGLSGLRYALPASLKWHLQRVAKPVVSSLRRKWSKSNSSSVSQGKLVTKQQRMKYLNQLSDEINCIKMPSERTAWSHYYENNYPDFSDTSKWTDKHHSFAKILELSCPATILDIGANTGWYSEFAAKKGIKVVATDVDDVCVDRMYNRLSNSEICLLPAVLDIRNPTPAKGLNYRQWPSAVSRFQVDLVVALALVHHLVFKHWLEFGQIVAALSAFSRDCLIIEFVGRNDRYVKEWLSPKYDFYTEENLMTVLRRYYKDITSFPSNLAERTIFFCRGKILQA